MYSSFLGISKLKVQRQRIKIRDPIDIIHITEGDYDFSLRFKSSESQTPTSIINPVDMHLIVFPIVYIENDWKIKQTE